MARKKSADTLDAEIAKVKSDMSKLQDRYDKLAEKLKDLQEQKRRIEADAIMDAYLKSGKTLDEIMTFLKP
jgi:predicted  nucleic acid-binding Zn-ribbon protein